MLASDSGIGSMSWRRDVRQGENRWASVLEAVNLVR